LGKGTLDVDENEHDIIMMKESGKFVIKDLEEEEAKNKLNKKLKRTRQEALGNENEDMDDNSDDEDAGTLKKMVKNIGGNKKQKVSNEGTSS